MITLLEMLVPAVGVSLLAVACLALLPRVPPELRFWIASAGLAAWAVPWPLLKWTLPPPLAETWLALPLVARVDAAAGNLAAARGPVGAAGAPIVSWLVGAAFVIGAAWLAIDYARMRAVLQTWRARSTDADSLRELLPVDLRGTKVEIRTVSDSPYAAASGYRRPTIWIGDELRGRETVRVALLHECWHVLRRDPLKVLLLTALRRAYWWNPLVRWLAKHAALMLEAACDRRCARELGKAFYVAELARTMLAASSPPPLALAAPAAGTRGSNLLRLDLLNRGTLMRARDHVVLWAFATSVLALVACQSVAPRTSATTPVPGLATFQAHDLQVTARMFTVSPDGIELTDMRLRTAGGIPKVTATSASAMYRVSVKPDTIMLTGHVLVAFEGSSLEADELTIRTLDGGAFDLANGAKIEGREIEITSPRARLTKSDR